MQNKVIYANAILSEYKKKIHIWIFSRCSSMCSLSTCGGVGQFRQQANYLLQGDQARLEVRVEI